MASNARLHAHKAKYGKGNGWMKWAIFVATLGVGTIVAGLRWGIAVIDAPSNIKTLDQRLTSEVDTRQYQYNGVTNQLSNIESDVHDTKATVEELKRTLYRIDGKISGMPQKQKDQLTTDSH